MNETELLRQFHNMVPLFYWDAGHPEWPCGPFQKRCQWLESQGIDDLISTYRVEFHLVDVPFAIIFRYDFSQPAKEYNLQRYRAPAIKILSDLPPEELR